MLLKEIKALKTVAGQDRFGNNIAGADKFDERRVYIVDTDMKPLENFMNMEAATRAIKNSPKKFVKGEFHIKTGKELNKLLGESVDTELPRLYNQRAALNYDLQDAREEGDQKKISKLLDKLGKISDAIEELEQRKKRKLKEEALETTAAEDLWSENKDSASSYTSTATYLVRPMKDTTPTKYEAFAVTGETRKPYGKFTAGELKSTLKPIRPNQTPDVEGFITYTDPAKVEAFKYSGDPVKVTLSDEESVVLNNGDYLVRTVKGSHFEYSTEVAGDFEATLKKA